MGMDLPEGKCCYLGTLSKIARSQLTRTLPKIVFSFITLLNSILYVFKDMQIHFLNFEKKKTLIWLEILLK